MTMAKSPPTDEQLVAAYVQLRNARDQIKAECDSRVADTVAKMDRVQMELMKRMASAGTISIKTAVASVTLQTKTHATCHDWEAFYSYVDEHKRYDFFPRKINSAVVRQAIEDSGIMPPGVRLENSQSVLVRRTPTKEA